MCNPSLTRAIVSDIAIFVLKRDVKLQLTNTCQPERFRDEYRTHYKALYKCHVYLLTLLFTRP